jgi:uncharacterized protein YndB with AHSA1/START domain
MEKITETGGFMANSPMTTPRIFTISRALAAPKELVWKAWTEADRIQQWWGPAGYSFSSGTLDLRPGGVFLYCMKPPTGQNMWGKFVYREMTEPDKLVFVTAFSDAEGETVRNPANVNWPLEVSNTVTLTEQDGKTVVTMQCVPINAIPEEVAAFTASFKSLQKGLKASFDQLETYLRNN